MNTYRLVHVGETETRTQLYNLFRNDTLLMQHVPYTKGHEYALNVIADDDMYIENCGGKDYCNESGKLLIEQSQRANKIYGHDRVRSTYHLSEEDAAHYPHLERNAVVALLMVKNLTDHALTQIYESGDYEKLIYAHDLSEPWFHEQVEAEMAHRLP